MASVAAAPAARVVEWSGGVTEVQLPHRTDASGGDYVALVQAAVEQAAALERGELRRVRKQPAPASARTDKQAVGQATDAAGAALGGQQQQLDDDAASKSNARRTTATDYAGWELALRGSTDDTDSDGADQDAWELQPVSEEERRAEEARATALASAEAHRERGNAAFKRGDFAAATAAYTAGIRHLPSATLLSNRAAAWLQLGQHADALHDCRAALTFDPHNVKAHTRAAKALQALGDTLEAVASARAALALSPREAPLKRLVRELEAAHAQATYEAGLLRAARTDVAARAAVEAELSLPEGTAATLAEVLSTVQLAQRLASGADHDGAGAEVATSGAFARALPRLRELLRAAARNRDAFVAAGGVVALLSCYAEDNQGVLASLVDAVTGCDRGAAALAAAAESGHATLLVTALRDRRVAVICAAVDLLAAAAPASRATRAALLVDSTCAQTVVLMMARAPPVLAQRATMLLAALAAADARATASALGQHGAALADGLARMLTPAKGTAPGAAQRAALDATAALCRASGPLCAALAAAPPMPLPLLSMLRADAGRAPEARRREFASGIAVVHRAWAKAPQDVVERLAACLALSAKLAAVSDALSAAWDADDEAWTEVLTLLEAPPALSAPAVTLLLACASSQPRCAAALAELGVAEPALMLIGHGKHDAAARDAAAALLTLCTSANSAALLRDLLRHGEADDSRGLPAACTLLVARAASDAAVEALAHMVRAAAEADAGAARYMSVTRPHFARDVARAWYERSAAPAARDALERVLMLLLSTDEGAAALAADADSEAHVVNLVHDLRMTRTITMARATGGASLLNPEALGMDSPYAMGDAALGPHPDAPRTKALSGIDIASVARYVATLVPPGCTEAATPGLASSRPVVVDASGAGGSAALRLAAALPGAQVYAAERSRRALDYCASAAAAQRVRNLAPVLCADGCMDALPVTAHACVMALSGEWLADAPHALASAATKLRAHGALLLIEEDLEALSAACAAAEAAGLEAFAAPELLNAHFVRVFRAP